MSLGEYIPTQNTKLLLHFNGNVNDDSGNNLSVTGSSYALSKLYGKFNEGVYCSGLSSARVEVTNNSLINLTTYTICLHFCITNFASGGTIISKWNNTNNALTNYYVDTAGSGNKLRVFFAANGTFYSILVNQSLVTNKWYNLIITAGSGVHNVYIDAKLLNITNYTGNIATNDTNLFICNRKLTSNGVYDGRLDGYVDELIVENNVWDQVKIQKYYTNALGRFATL